MINTIKRIVLESLLTPPRWGGRHTEIKNIKRGFPAHISSTHKGQKLIEKAVKELINDQFILCKKSTGEFHVSLNPRKKKAIMEFVVR